MADRKNSDKCSELEFGKWYRVQRINVAAKRRWPFLSMDWGPWFFKLSSRPCSTGLVVTFETWFRDPEGGSMRRRDERVVLDGDEDCAMLFKNIKTNCAPTQIPKLFEIESYMDSILRDIREYEVHHIERERHVPIMQFINKLAQVLNTVVRE